MRLNGRFCWDHHLEFPEIYQSYTSSHKSAWTCFYGPFTLYQVSLHFFELDIYKIHVEGSEEQCSSDPRHRRCNRRMCSDEERSPRTPFFLRKVYPRRVERRIRLRAMFSSAIRVKYTAASHARSSGLFSHPAPVQLRPRTLFSRSAIFNKKLTTDRRDPPGLNGSLMDGSVSYHTLTGPLQMKLRLQKRGAQRKKAQHRRTCEQILKQEGKRGSEGGDVGGCGWRLGWGRTQSLLYLP